jgi:ATP-binding cassette subfamily D (ALD) long-chain fatty acid import protein
VEKELSDLRERLANVEEWKRRREEIDQELNKVWIDGSAELAPPAYVEKDEVNSKANTDAPVSSASTAPPDIEVSNK